MHQGGLGPAVRRFACGRRIETADDLQPCLRHDHAHSHIRSNSFFPCLLTGASQHKTGLFVQCIKVVEQYQIGYGFQFHDGADEWPEQQAEELHGLEPDTIDAV